MNDNRTKKAQFSMILCAACVLTMGANIALAGEITGNGKSLKNGDGTLNGRSECAFSGLNDTYSGDREVADADGFFRTQSWGQLSWATRAFLTSIGISPGKACNQN